MLNGRSGKAGIKQTVGCILTGLMFLFLSVLAAGLIQPGNALAEEGWGPGQDKWKFELGGYFPSLDTTVRVNGVDIGDEIDIEDLLGFSDSEAIWRLEGYWRFFKRHRLDIGYYKLSRDASIFLEEDLEIGDEIFPIGALANSTLDMGFYSIDYRYSFYQGEKWEISGGLGAYWVDLELSVFAALQVGEEEEEQFFESTDFNGPLPFIGVAFEYYITPKWLAVAKGGFFALEVSDIDGTLTNLGAKLEYQFTKTFGLGLGYDYFRIDVTIEDADLRTELEYLFHGIQAYGILRF